LWLLPPEHADGDERSAEDQLMPNNGAYLTLASS
jgi:hypothetical protein